MLEVEGFCNICGRRGVSVGYEQGLGWICRECLALRSDQRQSSKLNEVNARIGNAAQRLTRASMTAQQGSWDDALEESRKAREELLKADLEIERLKKLERGA